MQLHTCMASETRTVARIGDKMDLYTTICFSIMLGALTALLVGFVIGLGIIAFKELKAYKPGALDGK